ncbi:hypothetical protein [Sanguibacter massiliensis]|uniref:hypothetical protein n=1 Tax=Sanguibacter massiliensis TaxID=1973217 RepID=UPI00101ADA37|nr:hypothetical protein [Sanguibacter massiliensis]
MSALALVLVECGQGDDPVSPQNSLAGSTAGVDGDDRPSAGGAASCEATEVEGEGAAKFITLGSPTAVPGDDGTARLSLPYTVTNPFDVPCIISPTIYFAEEGDESGTVDPQVLIPAGASVDLEVNSLRPYFIYDDDATDPVPPKEHEISVLDVSTDPVLPDYFDADVTVGPVSGEGADATVKVSIDHRAVLLEEPVDMGYPLGTSVFLQGLDAQGNVVAPLVLDLSTPEDGTKLEFDVPLSPDADYEFVTGAGVSVPFALDALPSVEKFVVGGYQPVVTM